MKLRYNRLTPTTFTPSPILVPTLEPIPYQPAALPLFQPVSSLDITFRFNHNDTSIEAPVSSLGTHAYLRAGENGYRQLFNATYSTASTQKAMQSTNIATAGIGLIFTETSTEEGYLGDPQIIHFPLNIPKTTQHYSYNVIDFWDHNQFNAYNVNLLRNKGARNHVFDAHASHRITLASHYPFITSPSTITTPGAYHLAVQKGNFHETFHHSEQAVMEFLESPQGINYITRLLKQTKAVTYLGSTLDLYSTRYMCENCNVGLVGLQNSQQQGFLHNLQTSVRRPDNRIETLAEGVLWSTRVSADHDGKGTSHTPFNVLAAKKDPDPVIPVMDHNHRHLVLQGNANQLGLPKAILDNQFSLNNYYGDFFTSRAVSKVGLEKELAKRTCLGV